jgi:hypothetical protein
MSREAWSVYPQDLGKADLITGGITIRSELAGGYDNEGVHAETSAAQDPRFGLKQPWVQEADLFVPSRGESPVEANHSGQRLLRNRSTQCCSVRGEISAS